DRDDPRRLLRPVIQDREGEAPAEPGSKARQEARPPRKVRSPMEAGEIAQTIYRLQSAFRDLALRGLRSAGPPGLAPLRPVREECERLGADYVAGRIAEVGRAIEAHDRSAARALVQAQASLRVFERILTLEIAAGVLQAMVDGKPAGEAP